MSHWLEEAENKQKKTKHYSRRFKNKISEKKQLIRDNYNKNNVQYEGFIQIMNNLVRRVNDLPEEHREAFKKISQNAKKTKLDNHLTFFYSSRREEKNDFFSLLWLKPIHAKHIRVFYIFVSKKEDYVSFELKENYLIRKRESGNEKTKKSTHEKSEHSKDRVHVIFPFHISKLDKKTGLEIIDWLVFKKQLHELPFWADTPIEQKQFF